MPNIGYFHPQIVHFVVALLCIGVLLRLVSLAGKWAFTGPAAATLLLVGTAAAVVAVKSGTDAHGPVERIPGARSAVTEHEDAGEWARNVFLVVVALEIAALALANRPVRRWVWAVSGVVGLAGVGAVYRASELGGRLVYKYAGGVGTRYGDTTDVQRLLLAGLYQQAVQDRAAKRPDAAAQTLELMSRRFPGDPNVQLLRAESQLLDLKDGKAALATLTQIPVPPDNRLLGIRIAFLKADAYLAVGFKDSARVALEALSRAFPNNARITERLDQLRQ